MHLKNKHTLLFTFLIIGQSAFAVQELGQFGAGSGTPVATPESSVGVSNLLYYSLAVTVAVELLVIIGLAFALKRLLRVCFGIDLKQLTAKAKIEAENSKVKKLKWFSFERINQTVPIEKEAELIMDHDYDGIHELDNKMPPWFLWLFRVTIGAAVIYLLVYHVFKTSPLQIDEYKNELAVAEKQMEEYRKNAANLVDENSVALLTDQSALQGGASIFNANCAACHGQKGEGVVGPNLTDDYWLHGGGIKNIFKTIKYGVVEKGMKSWQQDLSPSQIQQVSSYIHSLHGSNPPNAKEKQGELYKELAEGTSTTPDSINKIESDKI